MSTVASMSDAPGRYHCLLAVVRSAGGYPALLVDYAYAWAASDALVHVMTLPEAAHADAAAARDAHARPDGACGPDLATANAVRDSLLARGLNSTAALLPYANADKGFTSAVADAAISLGADVVLTCYPGLAHLAHVLPCSVLYLPADGSRRFRIPPRRIFVASDESASARGAFGEARRLAGEDAQLREACVSFEPATPVVPGSATIMLAATHHGDTLAHAILQAAREWRADLLVLGTHDPARQARWRFGSVASAVTLLTDMPLLVVPQKC
nr:universal stress protein [Paraburkholderia sp. UYCP14C]